jgi:AcrR family transcriptional regulator
LWVGLREDKRRRLRAAVIENAVALFRDRGFDAITVRQVAHRCDISEATFFNHFPTKDAVLSQWAYDELDRAFDAAAGASSLRQMLRDVAEALGEAAARDPAFAALAWQRARIAHLEAPASAIPLIEAAQRAGELRRDVPALELAKLFAGIAAITLATGLDAARAGAEADVARALATRLRQALDLVLDGSRRRHERVRPGQASPGPSPA